MMCAAPLRVAVVGAGPSGIFATAAILRKLPEARIDVLDRSSSPYGLVRYGVAPDHPKIKSVTRVLQRTLDAPQVRFVGNVLVGDRSRGAVLDLSDLQERYHIVVVATGAPIGNRLGIPGSELAGSCTAAEVVPWYNSSPEVAGPPVRSAHTAVVIGAGNVALDVARVLLKGADGLADTDVSADVLDQMRVLQTNEVHIVARRGPEAVRFGVPELRDLDRVADIAPIVDESDFVAEADDEPAATAVLRGWAMRGPGTAAKRLHFHFRREVVRVHGGPAVGAVELAPTGSGPAGGATTLEAELLVAAIGYRSEPMPGVPFDGTKGRFRHEAGRIGRGIYTVGWAKRGPQGVIGTNKVDAAETVATLVADVEVDRDGIVSRRINDDDVAGLAEARGVLPVGWNDWLAVDAAERELGQQWGCERRKYGWNADRVDLVAQSHAPVDDFTRT